MEDPDRRPAEDAEREEQLEPEPSPPEKDDERVDREAEETFPASDPPANY